MEWSVRSIPLRYHTLTLSPPHLITANLSALYWQSFLWPLLSLQPRQPFLSSSLTPFFVSSSAIPSSPFPFLSLPLLSPSPLSLSSLPLLSPSLPHTPHRKVMPRLSVLKWDNWTCWRQDQRRTAPSRLSR